MVISVKKTMHTRFLALVLSAVLLLPALAGCSKKTGAEKDLAYPIDGERFALTRRLLRMKRLSLSRAIALRGLSVWMNQAQSCPEPPSGGMCRRTGAPTPFICARG